MPATDESLDLARVIADGAAEKKAADLAILDVAEVLGVAEVFVLATAANERQLKAVEQELERRAREDRDRKPLRREGTLESGWLLTDYGDVVVHVFLPEQRDLYALDRLWGDVPRHDVAASALAVAEGGA